MVTWVFFRSADVSAAFTIIGRIASDFDIGCIPAFISQRPLWVAIVFISMLVHGIRERWFYLIQERFIALPWIVKVLLMFVVLQLAIELSNSEVQPFLYYKF